MKRIVAILMAAAMLLALTACGGESGGKTDQPEVKVALILEGSLGDESLKRRASLWSARTPPCMRTIWRAWWSRDST